MSQAYGNAFRQRVIEAIEGGMSRHAAAQRFKIAPSTAIGWMQRYTQTNSYEAFKRGGYRRPILHGYEESLVLLIEENPSITCREIQLFLCLQNIKIDETTISRFLKKLGISFKKNTARHRAKSS